MNENIHFLVNCFININKLQPSFAVFPFHFPFIGFSCLFTATFLLFLSQ